MNKTPFSIDAVMLGRNDDYEPNWNEKLCASIAYNRSIFAESRVDYRVTFVEWNPPPGKPLLALELVERFPFLRAIVVEPAVHAALCTSDHSVMLNFSLNCGLRTSTADYCLISAGDLFIGEQLAAYIKGLGLTRNCLYRAERVNIRDDLDFARANAADIENPANIVEINTCTEPPYDVPPYFHACGDFLLTDRLSMIGIRGFDEGIRFARLHLDSRFCHTAMAGGLHSNLIGQIFHINHSNSYTRQLGNYRDQRYDYMRGIPYINTVDWGLADHTWAALDDRIWSVSRPQGHAAERSIPFHLSAPELERANSVTRKIVAARNARPPEAPNSEAHQEKSLATNKFQTEAHWTGARVEPGQPTTITTVPAPWGYSAFLNLGPLLKSLDKREDVLFVEVDAQAREGSVGIGLISGNDLTSEVLLEAKDGRRKLHIAVSGKEQAVLVRNAELVSRSSIVSIHGIRILRQPRSVIDEADFLL